VLTSEEEVRVAGRPFSAWEAGPALPRDGTCEVGQPPSSNERRPIVRFLKGLLVECKGDEAMPGVSEGAQGETKVAKKMWQDLRASYAKHLAQPTLELGVDCAVLGLLLRSQGEMLSNARCALEEWLLASVSTIPSAAGRGADGGRMRRACNLVPTVTARDLARAACRPDLLRTFNPLLSTRAVARVREGILEWLQMCVLEDKLGRMEGFARDGLKQDLERELQELDPNP